MYLNEAAVCVCVCACARVRQWLSSAQQREGWSCTFKKEKLQQLCRRRPDVLLLLIGVRTQPLVFCQGRCQRAGIQKFKCSPQLHKQKVKDNCRLSNNSDAKLPHTHTPPPSHSLLSSHHNAATQHAPRQPPSLCFSPQSLTIQLVSLLALLSRLHTGFFFFLCFLRSKNVERGLDKRSNQLL